MKFQIFEKYSKSFSQLKHLPANESPTSREKSLLWTHNWGMRLVLPATESPEQGKTIIEFLTIFAKTKYFSKITKTFKNLFVIDQQRLSMRKHI